MAIKNFRIGIQIFGTHDATRQKMKEISWGNHFRSALRKLKRQYGKAGTLADSSEVPRSVISRALSGECRPGLKTLNKLVDLLPVEEGAELVAAYLTDQIPAKLARDVCVCVREKKGQFRESFVQKMLSLPFETRLALEALIDAMLNPNSPPSSRSRSAAELLPPGSRDHTQAQGLPLREKIARFPLIPLLVSLSLAVFSVSSDCEHFLHSVTASCPEGENPVLYAEIHEEHKQL